MQSHVVGKLLCISSMRIVVAECLALVAIVVTVIRKGQRQKVATSTSDTLPPSSMHTIPSRNCDYDKLSCKACEFNPETNNTCGGSMYQAS